MLAKIIVLECITNMHVGNGDVNYNIIDNEVERDPVTNYPAINASGVKGALREYFTSREALSAAVDGIFGRDTQESTQGKVKILGAEMLAMPARASLGDRAYYHITTKDAVERFKEQCSIFLQKEAALKAAAKDGEKQAEGIKLKNAYILLGKDLYEIPEDKFRGISLPVMARNKLDNGISKNLWYEEIVPHGSLFYFPVVVNDTDEIWLEKLVAGIKGQVVQFGGNASIGYGLCKVSVWGEE